MRAGITVVFLIVFCAVMTYYINMAFSPIQSMSVSNLKLMFYADLFLLTLIIYFNSGIEGILRYVNQICTLALATSFLIPMLYYSGFVKSAKDLMLLFDGSVIVASLVVLITGVRHGYFK